MKYRFHYDGSRRRGPLGIIRIIGMVIGGVALAVLFAFLFGYIVMLLWNWLMPELFGLKIITFWQAFALVLLAKLLFGGFGRHGHGPWGRRGRCGYHGYRRIPESIAMNPERFEKFWSEEGERAFDDYIKRTENNVDAER